MSSLWKKYYLAPLLLLFAIWSAWFIQQGSFLVAGERYYSLFDDAMISMTYAKNCSQGLGLNWAKFGEPVEGFSSPLWTFLMIPFQFLPIAWSKVSLAFAIFCAGVMATNVVVLDRLLRDRLGVDVLWLRYLAAFVLAFLYPLNYWSLVGMECGPQVLLFLLGLDRFLAFDQSKVAKHLYQLGMVLAASLLLRMDMVFFVGIVIAFLVPWMWKNHEVALKFLFLTGGPMFLYLVFRGMYFHDFFPNTYYLKIYKIPLDFRVERAWFYFAKWAEPLWLIWALLPIMMVPLWRNKGMWLTFVLIVTYLAYNLYAGGDAWEEAEVGANRFTIIVIPWIVVIFAAGGYAWGTLLKGKAASPIRLALPSIALAMLFILVNGLLFVPRAKARRECFMVLKPPYNTQFQMWNTQKAVAMNGYLGSGNRAAMVQAGDIGYFANCELVDLVGYNGREIARQRPYWNLRSTPLPCYVPGHVKVNYLHTIGTLKPDHIVDSWTKFNDTIERQFDSLLVAGHYLKAGYGGWDKENYSKRDK